MVKSIWVNIFFGLVLYGNFNCCYGKDGLSQRLRNFIEKTDAVSSSGKPTQERAYLIDSEYKKDFDVVPAAMADNELPLYFEATQYVMFYTLDKSKLLLFETIFSRLVDTRQATSEQSGKLLQMYYALREFEKANSFIERSGGSSVQRSPIVIHDLTGPSSTRTAWAFHGQRGLMRIDMNVNKGRHLVIIASPYCPFAARALSEIESNPAFAPLLREKVTVMAMPDFNFDYEMYTRWNQLHPSLPFTLTHSRAEWPEISHWVSPLFLFFRNGRLDSTFSGWDKDGNWDKMYEGFGITVSAY